MVQPCANTPLRRSSRGISKKNVLSMLSEIVENRFRNLQYLVPAALETPHKISAFLRHPHENTS